MGVIGANGSGKTTLLRLITGEEQPDRGTLQLGETVRLGYVNQDRDSFNSAKTVWEEISEGNEEVTLGSRKVASRASLKPRTRNRSLSDVESARSNGRSNGRRCFEALRSHWTRSDEEASKLFEAADPPDDDVVADDDDDDGAPCCPPESW